MGSTSCARARPRSKPCEASSDFSGTRGREGSGKRGSEEGGGVRVRSSSSSSSSGLLSSEEDGPAGELELEPDDSEDGVGDDGRATASVTPAAAGEEEGEEGPGLKPLLPNFWRFRGGCLTSESESESASSAGTTSPFPFLRCFFFSEGRGAPVFSSSPSEGSNTFLSPPSLPFDSVSSPASWCRTADAARDLVAAALRCFLLSFFALRYLLLALVFYDASPGMKNGRICGSGETTHFDRSYPRCCHKPSQNWLCRQAPVKSANPMRVQSSVRLCHRLFLRDELLARHPKIVDYDIDITPNTGTIPFTNEDKWKCIESAKLYNNTRVSSSDHSSDSVSMFHQQPRPSVSQIYKSRSHPSIVCEQFLEIVSGGRLDGRVDIWI